MQHESDIYLKPVIDLSGSQCADLACAGKYEWLVTNGIGGFASGTVAGFLSRRYHGLLVAALKPPLGRTLLVPKLDETVLYSGIEYQLFSNRWANKIVDPEGYVHLQRFHLEGTTPVWTYILGDALIEKRIWMQQGSNTTYIQYELKRAQDPVQLSIKAFANYRDYHGATRTTEWEMEIQPVEHGLRIQAYPEAVPFFMLCSGAAVELWHDWYRDYLLQQEVYRGFDGREDHLHAGSFLAELQVGKPMTFVVGTTNRYEVDGTKKFEEQVAYEKSLIQVAKAIVPEHQQLVLAANQFIVKRESQVVEDGRSIIAGYPWFGDWGRDTMIALPGLTLATGRPEIARSMLLTYAQYMDQGMIPNRFPDVGDEPEYNTVDATLWYVEAIRAYYEATRDNALLDELMPILDEMVDWHLEGTRYQIRVDPEDGLLYAGEPGVQLTWMDAKVGDWVVTPRIGKPVEVNALWYHALRTLGFFARELGIAVDRYDELADQTREGFSKFWNPEKSFCFDVLDIPDGHDTRLRPNQLFAVSLPFSALNLDQQKAVVDSCARHLYTPMGLRSLAPDESDYVGTYGGTTYQRDGAYHQGTVWSWLLGPFIKAHLRVYNDPLLAASFAQPLISQLKESNLGSISEIFDGDAPFSSRGAVAQAWGVAALLDVISIANTP